MRTRLALFLSAVCCLCMLGTSTLTHAQDTAQPPAPAVPETVVPEADVAAVDVLGADTPEADALAPPKRVLTLDLTRDANDIWDRIRRGFGMSDLDSERVSDQQAFYINRPAFLKQVFARGGRYLYYIVDELERRGMPTELALLPMVESSYNPLAYSRSHASGLWQFIPSTGKYFNLTQDSWVDERRDVIASTNAALDYLQKIYEMHGDWHLALASYNWGEGAVQRALKRNLEEGLPGEYSYLRMPEETRNYVPKLQAIKNIVSEPELFHFELPYVANEMHFVAVEAPIGVDLATAAELSEMPVDEFLALNPGFNRPVTTVAGQSFIVPTDRARRLREGLEELERSGKVWRLHAVERGEQLSEIAAEHGLTVSELRQINGLAGNTSGAGQTLLVPAGIDPEGALELSSMLPFAGATTRQQGLKIQRTAGAAGGTGLKAPVRSAPAAGASALNQAPAAVKPAQQPTPARTKAGAVRSKSTAKPPKAGANAKAKPPTSAPATKAKAAKPKQR